MHKTTEYFIRFGIFPELETHAPKGWNFSHEYGPVPQSNNCNMRVTDLPMTVQHLSSYAREEESALLKTKAPVLQWFRLSGSKTTAG